MKLEIKWISMFAAFRVGLLFHLVAHSLLVIAAFIVFPRADFIFTLTLAVLISSLCGGVLWLLGAATYNFVSALNGGLVLHLGKVKVRSQPAPAVQQNPQPSYSRLASERRRSRTAPLDPPFTIKEEKKPLTEAEIEERRQWDNRQYRIQRYNRLQERRREIRDE